jgi:hypothetical protein
LINSIYFDGNEKHGASHTTLPGTGVTTKDMQLIGSDAKRAGREVTGGRSQGLIITRSVTRQIARFQNDRWTGQRQARKMQRKKRWLKQRRKQVLHPLIDAAGNEGVLLSFP